MKKKLSMKLPALLLALALSLSLLSGCGSTAASSSAASAPAASSQAAASSAAGTQQITDMPVEDVVFQPDGAIRIAAGVTVKPGEGIRQAGSTVRAGELLLRKGCRLVPTDLCVLGTGGILEIPVFRRPVVAIIPTGSELIPLGEIPRRGQNLDSNSLMLKHMNGYLKFFDRFKEQGPDCTYSQLTALCGVYLYSAMRDWALEAKKIILEKEVDPQ